jgi:hypothetical protein
MYSIDEATLQEDQLMKSVTPTHSDRACVLQEERVFWLETVEDNSGQNNTPGRKRYLKRAGFLHMHDEALRLLDGSDEVSASY